ncbi:MAG: hypothetical protein V2A73_13920, partial [Pseudomonadota bacterium]
MTVHISKLLRFEGYGSRNPGKMFFIGLEERSPDGDLANLEARSAFPCDRMDMRLASELLFGDGWWGETKMKRVRVWQVAARIRMALDGDEANWRTERDERLGRSNGDTLLTELLPIPRNIGDNPWPKHYRAALGFADYDHYVDAVLADRLDLLRSMLERHKPEYVFCYGITSCKIFEALFPRTSFTPDEVQAGGRQQRFLHGCSDSTVIVITNHYSGSKRPFTSGFVGPL